MPVFRDYSHTSRTAEKGQLGSNGVAVPVFLRRPREFHADVEVAVFARPAETLAARLSLKSCSIVSGATGLE
jgi:hypothetical protein